jgi:hypothetical protein
MSTPYRDVAEMPAVEAPPTPRAPWWTVGRVSLAILGLAWVLGNAGVVITEWPVTHKTIGGMLITNAGALLIVVFGYFTYPRSR